MSMFIVRCPECGIDVGQLPPCYKCGYQYGCCPCFHEDDES